MEKDREIRDERGRVEHRKQERRKRTKKVEKRFGLPPRSKCSLI